MRHRPQGSYNSLIASLSSVIGRRAAGHEFRWMKDSLQTTPEPSLSSKLSEMVRRRMHGEPLQYIIGTQPFGPLELLVRPPTLIPRPETEEWTLRLSHFVRPTSSAPMKMLDLCTGSGCIPLLLCHLWPAGSIHAVGVDIAPEALDLAQENAHRCRIRVESSSQFHRDRIEGELQAHTNQQAKRPELEFKTNVLSLLRADVFHPAFSTHMSTAAAKIDSGPSSKKFDLITANPPYIPRREYDMLPVSVRNYEDRRALLGDPDDNEDARSYTRSSRTHKASDTHLPVTPDEDGDGLAFYRRIADLLSLPSDQALLNVGGTIAIEVGHDQSDRVYHIFAGQAGLKDVQVWNDAWGKKRVVLGRR